MEVQTFLFAKAKHWTNRSASRWLQKHGRLRDLDEKPDTLRYRQLDPDLFIPGSFRTYDVPDEVGIQVVLGKLRAKK